MSESGDRPKVRLRSASVVLPAVTVECSGWPRSDGPRARVNLKPVAEHVLPTGEQWLELRLPVEAADPDATARLIRAADAAAPELGLAYDRARSGVDGGEVVVALTPTHPVGPADRLAEIVRTLAAAPHTTAAWRHAG